MGDRIMTIDTKKLQEFKVKIKELNLAASKPENTITQAQRDAGVEIACQYYEYLKVNGEIYGNAALQVATDTGWFGRTANVHLRTQAKFEGKPEEYLPELQDRVKISLAYADMEARATHKGELAYKLISDYHKEVFKGLDLSPYAWGGLAVEELFGPGKWMALHDRDEREYFAMLAQFAKAYSKSSGYSVDRMISSVQHSAACVALGETPYSPIASGLSVEDVAKQYDVDTSRVEWISDELEVIVHGAPSAACGPVTKIYKILPAAEFVPEAGRGSVPPIATQEETSDEEGDSSGWEDEESEEEEQDDRGASHNPREVSHSMSANKKIQELLSNPTKLKKHQEASMKEAMSGLADAEEFVPGIAGASMQSFQQHQEFLSNLMGLSSQGAPMDVRKAGAKVGVKSPSKSKVTSQAHNQTIPAEHADWASSLATDTESMMQDFMQNTDMHDFMSTLMGREFNPHS